MKKQLAVLILAALSLNGNVLFSQEENQYLRQIIDTVSKDSLTVTLEELTGMREVTIDGNLRRIQSRAVDAPDHADALQYLVNRFRSFGLNPLQKSFTTGYDVLPGFNLYAEQPGQSPEAKRYILCAHYDNRPYYSSKAKAPGADDNGSGVAAVIEAARILSRYSTRNTIVYALWDREETGTEGSHAYAAAAYAEKHPIAGVLNCDMIGYDHNNDSKCDIHLVDTARSRQLADTVLFINSTYGIGMHPVVYAPGILASDHREFIRLGYSAVLVTEDFEGDFNSHYHWPSDSLQYLNLSYLQNNAKLTIGALAQVAGVQTTLSASEAPSVDVPRTCALKQNYPNPFNPSTTIEYRVPARAHVRLEVVDMLGRTVSVLVNEELPAGSRMVQWNAADMASGMYFCRFTAGAYVEMKKMVLMK